MKKGTALFFILFIISCICVISGCTSSQDQVRHMVIFKYKSTASEAQIKEVTDAFADLKNKIPGILSFEAGVNNSPENLNQGFTHVYLLTFKDAASRDAYLPHPEHKKFGEFLGKADVLEEAFVVDYNPAKQ